MRSRYRLDGASERLAQYGERVRLGIDPARVDGGLEGTGLSDRGEIQACLGDRYLGVPHLLPDLWLHCQLGQRIFEIGWRVTAGIRPERRSVVRVQVAMQAGRLIDFAKERVLANEATDLGIEVPRLGVETPVRRSSVVPIRLWSAAFFS